MPWAWVPWSWIHGSTTVTGVAVADTSGNVGQSADIVQRLDDLSQQVSRVATTVEAILQQETLMAHTIDDLVAAVAAESTVSNSIIALLNSVEQQLKDALANVGGFTPEQQVKVDGVFDTATASAKAISDAVAANTPVAAVAPVKV